MQGFITICDAGGLSSIGVVVVTNTVLVEKSAWKQGNKKMRKHTVSYSSHRVALGPSNVLVL